MNVWNAVLGDCGVEAICMPYACEVIEERARAERWLGHRAIADGVVAWEVTAVVDREFLVVLGWRNLDEDGDDIRRH